MKTIPSIIERVLENIIGFNDRGIVEYNEDNRGLGYLMHGVWKGVCNSCGKKFKGKEEIESIRFGHVGCPKPDGKYIKNDATPEKIESALTSAIEEVGNNLIGGDESTELGGGVHYEQECSNEARNELRAEQRQKLSQLLKK
jgi:hypothetical protein